MGMLLGFAPFLAFVVIERLVDVHTGLAAGAVVAAMLIIRDALTRGRQVKILEIGTFLLFTGLSVLAASRQADPWSIAAVRLRVDAGLLVIMLASMAIGRPFTLQYARENTPGSVWQAPAFIRTNYVITAAWAAAFAVLVVADVAMTYLPGVPHSISIVATVLALFAAAKFTSGYAGRQRGDATGP